MSGLDGGPTFRVELEAPLSAVSAPARACAESQPAVREVRHSRVVASDITGATVSAERDAEISY
jgi:hypothetical protein